MAETTIYLVKHNLGEDWYWNEQKEHWTVLMSTATNFHGKLIKLKARIEKLQKDNKVSLKIIVITKTEIPL